MSHNTIHPTLGLDDVYIVPTQDGSETVFSRAFNATYHSVFGAVGESKHVFIQQGLLTQLQKPEIHILEFGFGTGLNAFLAYLFGLRHNKPISYTGIEAFPLDISVVSKLGYPEYLGFVEEKEVFLRMHTEESFISGSFHFRKIPSITDIERGSFDCIFFDAFAPAFQPECWEQEQFDHLFEITSPLGCLVTYCAQGEVRRRLVKAGYSVDRIPGPPGKREMLRGVKGE